MSFLLFTFALISSFSGAFAAEPSACVTKMKTEAEMSNILAQLFCEHADVPQQDCVINLHKNAELAPADAANYCRRIAANTDKQACVINMHQNAKMRTDLAQSFCLDDRMTAEVQACVLEQYNNQGKTIDEARQNCLN